MLKKTITFTDFNDNERTEDFYFALSKAELLSMELGISGGLTEMLKKIIASQDSAQLIKLWQDLILKTYGEKSPDGRKFIKSPELSEDFSQTNAYVELFMELSTNTEAAFAFINSVAPKEIQDHLKSVKAVKTSSKS